jgi:hypothetical protein
MRLTTRLVSSLFLAFLVFGEFHSTAKAQYSVSTSVGSDFMFFPPPAFQFVTKTLIIGGTQADTMSAWQSLPFPWKLFGTTVTGFRASDNGYVTFTNNSDPNVPNPIAIPSSAAPNMAIYAFWHDWDLATNMGGPMGVFTFTYGTAPQRTFYIEWAGATSTVLHEPYSFAIALKECGDFEVIVMRGHTNSTVTGIEGDNGGREPGSSFSNFGKLQSGRRHCVHFHGYNQAP